MTTTTTSRSRLESLRFKCPEMDHGCVREKLEDEVCDSPRELCSLVNEIGAVAPECTRRLQNLRSDSN